MTTVTMRNMFEAGVHYGHRNSFRNPKMDPYIFTSRNKINIINLEVTLPKFNEALSVVRKISNRNGKILFVGTKKAASSLIKEHATRCDMPYVDHRWLGGMLTNFKTVKQSIKRMIDLEKMDDDGSIDLLIKKEALGKRREMEKLQKSLGGIKNMRNLPDALFVIDVGYEKIAVSEANKLGIPVIGIVDTNNSPKGVNYLVPGNDDATKSIALYTSSMADAILESKNLSKGITEELEEEFVEVSDED